MPIYMLSLCRVPRCASMTIHQSAAQVCWEKVTRISSCISEVHFHPHAAFQRGSGGPLWQLGLPAGVEIKRGPKNRPGSWEQSTGEWRGGWKRERREEASVSSWGCRCMDGGWPMRRDCSLCQGVQLWRTHGGAAAPVQIRSNITDFEFYLTILAFTGTDYRSVGPCSADQHY